MTEVKKIATFYDKYSNTVTYEYRGYKYDVEYAIGMNYCITSPRIQHEDAQRRIDKLIEQEANTTEAKPIDWNKIFNTLGWD